MSKIVDKEALKAFRQRLDNKYVIEGEYSPETKVGYADLAGNLDSKVVKNDLSAYLFRTAGGSLEIGDYCKVNSIIGGSLGFNQLVENGNFASSTGWATTGGTFSVANNIGTFTANIEHQQLYQLRSLIANHKYLAIANVKLTTGNTSVCLRMYSLDLVFTKNTTSWQTLCAIVSVVSNTYSSIGIKDDRSSGWDAIQVKNVMVIDLTAMFGSTIADYIYNLETQTAGAGVAWFRKYFPKLYYPYTPIGAFVNVMTKGKKYIGFNAYNHETGKAELLGGINYHIGGTYSSVSYVDINGNAETLSINANGQFTPTNNGVLTVVGGNATNTCVHLDYGNMERFDEWEEYKETIVPLDTNWNSIGIPQIDENGNLYFIGNRYKYDGSVDEEYDKVKLKDLRWIKGGNDFFGYGLADVIKKPSVTTEKANIFTPLYIAVKQTQLSSSGTICITIDGTVVIETDGSQYADGTAFKNHFTDNDYLIYQKATITQGTPITPFPLRQLVDNWGTEQFLAPDNDTRVCEVPVGHDTNYPMDCKSKIEIAPDLPANDGVYACKVESGVAEYVSLPTWLSSNGYEKSVDLSSQITNVLSGLTQTYSKIYKTGNIVCISLKLKNDTGSQFGENTTLLTLPSGTYNTNTAYNAVGFVSGSVARLRINTTGIIETKSNIAVGETIELFVSYAVA